MTEFEAMGILRSPLHFGDAKQIEAVKFIEAVDELESLLRSGDAYILPCYYCRDGVTDDGEDCGCAEGTGGARLNLAYNSEWSADVALAAQKRIGRTPG